MSINPFFAQLQAVELKKLPPAVITGLVHAVTGDLAAAVAKAVSKRPSPKAVARAFAECVMGVRAADSKGSECPFGQLRSANEDVQEFLP